MTALDHLAVLRTIFESVLSGCIALILVVSTSLLFPLFLPMRRPLETLQAHAFFRWRTTVTYGFGYRFYQELYAHGIIAPRVFA
jgi:hypothetical protein